MKGVVGGRKSVTGQKIAESSEYWNCNDAFTPLRHAGWWPGLSERGFLEDLGINRWAILEVMPLPFSFLALPRAVSNFQFTFASFNKHSNWYPSQKEQIFWSMRMKIEGYTQWPSTLDSLWTRDLSSRTSIFDLKHCCSRTFLLILTEELYIIIIYFIQLGWVRCPDQRTMK